MAFTYDLASDGGKVRLLVPDNNDADYIFEDEEISTFLLLEGGVKRAAALALETIARNEVMVLKVISLLDITTDGASVARELRFQAEELRKQAAQDDDDLYADEGAVIIGMVVDQFTARQALLRSAGSLY
jgi:hypothetical protein